MARAQAPSSSESLSTLLSSTIIPEFGLSVSTIKSAKPSPDSLLERIPHAPFPTTSQIGKHDRIFPFLPEDPWDQEH